jgi:surfeit locus 1 family protein
MKTRTFSFGELEIRFNWIIAIFVLLAFAGLVRLGIWQLGRAQEKIDLQNTYTEMGEDYAVPIEDVGMSGLENDAKTIQNLHVSLTGEFQNDRSIFLIYQSYEDALGYEIITPFKLSSSEKIAFVSRGWTLASTYEQVSAKVNPVEGEMTIEGQIFVPTEKQAARTNDIDLSNHRWPLELRFLNTLEIDPLFDESLFPYEVRLDEGQPGLFVRHWPTVIVDTGRNFSYALQWFSMAFALLIVTFVLSSNVLKLINSNKKPL